MKITHKHTRIELPGPPFSRIQHGGLSCPRTCIKKTHKMRMFMTWSLMYGVHTKLENQVTNMARDKPTTSSRENWNQHPNPCAFVRQTNRTNLHMEKPDISLDPSACLVDYHKEKHVDT